MAAEANQGGLDGGPEEGQEEPAALMDPPDPRATLTALEREMKPAAISAADEKHELLHGDLGGILVPSAPPGLRSHAPAEEVPLPPPPEPLFPRTWVHCSNRCGFYATGRSGAQQFMTFCCPGCATWADDHSASCQQITLDLGRRLCAAFGSRQRVELGRVAGPTAAAQARQLLRTMPKPEHEEEMQQHLEYYGYARAQSQGATASTESAPPGEARAQLSPSRPPQWRDRRASSAVRWTRVANIWQPERQWGQRASNSRVLDTCPHPTMLQWLPRASASMGETRARVCSAGLVCSRQLHRPSCRRR